MITYEWEIRQVDTVSVGDMSDVIERVHWSYKGIDENGVTGDCSGVAVFAVKDNTFRNGSGQLVTYHSDLSPSNFIQYSSLTKSQVVEWVKSQLGDMTGYEHAIKGQIDAKNHSSSSKPLPW